MNTKLLSLFLTLVFVSLATSAAAGPVPLPGEETVTVTLELDASTYTSATLQETKTCSVTLPAGTVLADVLDKATLDACIAGWTWTTCASCITAGYGRMVTGVDGRQANCDVWATWFVGIDPPLCTWYTIEENGESASAGVDHLRVTEGSTYTFVFNNVFAPSLP